MPLFGGMEGGGEGGGRISFGFFFTVRNSVRGRLPHAAGAQGRLAIDLLDGARRLHVRSSVVAMFDDPGSVAVPRKGSVGSVGARPIPPKMQCGGSVRGSTWKALHQSQARDSHRASERLCSVGLAHFDSVCSVAPLPV